VTTPTTVVAARPNPTPVGQLLIEDLQRDAHGGTEHHGDGHADPDGAQRSAVSLLAQERRDDGALISITVALHPPENRVEACVGAVVCDVGSAAGCCTRVALLDAKLLDLLL
jgi:hypothetical protein